MVRHVDLRQIRMAPGSGAVQQPRVQVEPLVLGGQEYGPPGLSVDARLDLSRTLTGWAFRLRFETVVGGPCMRCLADAAPTVSVDAREVDQSDGDDELASAYVEDGMLDLGAWVRDSLAEALPEIVLCDPLCRGLCGVCGVDMNDPANVEHAHDSAIDPRLAKLSEIRIG